VSKDVSEYPRAKQFEEHWPGRYGVSISAGTKDISHLRNVQTGFGTQPASNKLGTGGSFACGTITGTRS